MSEQQKDGSTVEPGEMGTVSPAPAAQPETPDGGAAKSKRRSSAKAKAPPEAGEEAAKPKRARSSSRTAKVPVAPTVPSAGDGLQDVTGTPTHPEPAGMPPLPPVPVPTPEGIAFMQQHVAFQTAMEQRAAWRQAEWERLRQEKRDAALRAAGDQQGASLTYGDVAEHGTVPAQDGSTLGKTIANGPARARAGKAALRNSIEVGPKFMQEPVQAGDPEVAKGGDVQPPPTGKAKSNKGASEAAQEAPAVDGTKPQPLHEAGKPLDKREAEASTVSAAVPESVRRKFLKVDSEYYFPDRSPAFVDRGTRLATRGEHPEVVAALVDIARERGWNSITVKGTEPFRRAAWMEASRSGLQVAGYKPTELDLAQLRQREPANLVEQGAVREHGAAPPSTSAKASALEADKVAGDKSKAFASERPTLVVKKYPDLVQAYALLDAARKFAAQHMPGHEGQFVAIGKELIAQQIQQGKEVIGPKIYPEQLGQSRSGSQKVAPNAEKQVQSEPPVRER